MGQHSRASRNSERIFCLLRSAHCSLSGDAAIIGCGEERFQHNALLPAWANNGYSRQPLSSKVPRGTKGPRTHHVPRDPPQSWSWRGKRNGRPFLAAATLLSVQLHPSYQDMKLRRIAAGVAAPSFFSVQHLHLRGGAHENMFSKFTPAFGWKIAGEARMRSPYLSITSRHQRPSWWRAPFASTPAMWCGNQAGQSAA